MKPAQRSQVEQAAAEGAQAVAEAASRQWFDEYGNVRPEGTPGAKQLTYEQRVAIAKKRQG